MRGRGGGRKAKSAPTYSMSRFRATEARANRRRLSSTGSSDRSSTASGRVLVDQTLEQGACVVAGLHRHAGDLIEALGGKLLLTADQQCNHHFVVIVCDFAQGGLEHGWIVLAVDDRYVSDTGPPAWGKVIETRSRDSQVTLCSPT